MCRIVCPGNTTVLDSTDRAIVNLLQDGLPVCERPFAVAADRLCMGEQELIAHLGRLLDEGVLTRFGPMFDAERLGGAFSLCAMRVSPDRFDAVAKQVNAFPEVAHNYQRDHEYNMWFIIAVDSIERVASVIDTIQRKTGLDVLNFPKLEEYYVGLRLEA